ncbi:hypothetical protein D4764_11G0004050 [Takifugu flavidus]|uniref:Kazal-like domain-containing protein n=1 Tax=Takifugu flavidus TaxID=433684 RepID=A0A5C6PES5_9TELE|nr:hypothetical protein D4764_11G0004050 [Takifugu flavidus]
MSKGTPVCSVLGNTYANECVLHREACRKRCRIGLAHRGACLVPNWFLLLSRVGKSYSPGASSQRCLSHRQRTQLAQERFTMLDRNKDGTLSRVDLKKMTYRTMPLESCAMLFFQSDPPPTTPVTLQGLIPAIPSNDNVYYLLGVPLLMDAHKWKQYPPDSYGGDEWMVPTSLSQLGCVYRSCDHNRNKKVTLQQWTTCLVDRTEAWFHSFMC